ncbi:MAG: ABC transporter permease [Spirochaetes bacterium]|nr:ABC transporter permease [Spirochaetota bacterium]
MKLIRKIQKQFSTLFDFITTLLKLRSLIVQLAKRDFKNRFAASYLGIYWAFIQPFITFFVIWFVFTVGFKSSNIEPSIPFVPWLLCGMLPWFFMQDVVNQGTQSLINYSYLITKINFRSSMIPIIKIATSLAIHLIFLIILVIVTLLYGIPPALQWVQIIYFLFCSVILLLSITWLTSSITVFFRDMENIVNVGMQILFWATPIFWHHSVLSGKLQYIAYLNPFFYIINGYRDTFIYHQWFFSKPLFTCYFWIFSTLCFIGSALVFSRLKPHFADVL